MLLALYPSHPKSKGVIKFVENTSFIRKNIPLPKGDVLEVDLTPEFLQVVQKHFDLPSTKSVENDHIRMFIWGSFKNAIDKAEAQGQI